jgi:uncharacterized protein
MKKDETILDSTKKWLLCVVIGNNFCPFARKVHIENRIRYVVSKAETREELSSELLSELEFLVKTEATEVDTSLIILPTLLSDFFDYNDFLETANTLLVKNGFEGFVQIASFHPQYQFAGTDADDISNFTNRSPYPMLHLLREASVAHAIDSYPEVDEIPERNIKFLTELDSVAAAKLRAFSQTE